MKSRTRAEGAASNVQTEVQTYNRFLSTALAMASIDSPVLDKRCSSAHIANRQELVPYFGRLTEAEEQATTVEITGFSHKSVDIYATRYLSQVGETAAAAGITNNWRCMLPSCHSLYWCVQEVVEYKEEELLNASHKASTGAPSSILSESQYTHVHKLFNVTVVLLYTGIDDLADVKRLLKNFNDWQSLGLELGLLYNTLKRIEEEQRGVISKCKTEMLAAWLQQQDNVAKNGVPSWSTLKTGLMNIDKNLLADSIVIT